MLTSSFESHVSGKIPKWKSIFIDLYMLASNCWLDEINKDNLLTFA